MAVRFTAAWLVCVLMVFPADLLACTCVPAGPFLSVSARETLIVRGTVARYVGHGMDVDVRETLKGQPGAATVRIWGDTGLLCRPYVSQFPIGTEWVFAVRPSVERGESGYAISACGEYAMRVEKDRVSGESTSMSLSDLRRRLTSAAPRP